MDKTGKHAKKTDTLGKASTDTRVIHSGKTSADHHGAVNTPVYHASTLLFPTVEGFLNRGQAEYRYGRRGTPTTKSLEAAVTQLEQADAAFLAPSGKAATDRTACTPAGALPRTITAAGPSPAPPLWAQKYSARSGKTMSMPASQRRRVCWCR